LAASDPDANCPRREPFEFTLSRVQEFLAFGFLLRSTQDPLSLLAEWSRRPRRDTGYTSEAGLAAEGVRAFGEAVDRCIGEGPVFGRQIVLLSGGLDSRAILAALLRRFDRSEIVAATFGLPGEQDFDFARRVAQTAGVQHVRLETLSAEWSTSALVESVLAREIPLPNPFGQRFLSYCVHRDLGSRNIFWDGLCGDAVGGDWAPGPEESFTWDGAVEHWLKRHLVSGSRIATKHRAGITGSASLHTIDLDPREVVPDVPYLPDTVLSYPDQLDFGLRQRQYIATRRMRGYIIRTPFLKGPWLDFMLGVPARLRQRQYLYREILKALDPRLFSLPLTTFKGGSLLETASAQRCRRSLDHLRRCLARVGFASGSPDRPKSANHGIRSQLGRCSAIRELVIENLRDLGHRGLVDPIDLDVALGCPDRSEPRHSLLTVLLGLELNLKANDVLSSMSEAAGATSSR
jgi:hypothetical protein